MTLRTFWDKRLSNTSSPSLLTLSPPGTFIYRVVSVGFDGNSNFQACYTHQAANGIDLSLWAADNDQLVLTEVTGATTADTMSNATPLVFTTYSSSAGQQIKITNFDGYFIFEATDGVPADNANNFTNTTASTLFIQPARPYDASGTTVNDTNFPWPTPIDFEIASVSDTSVTPTLDFPIILGGTGGGDTEGRPSDGLLYPRGFQPI